MEQPPERRRALEGVLDTPLLPLAVVALLVLIAAPVPDLRAHLSGAEVRPVPTALGELPPPRPDVVVGRPHHDQHPSPPARRRPPTPPRRVLPVTTWLPPVGVPPTPAPLLLPATVPGYVDSPPVPAPPVAPPAGARTAFTVASYNVLGYEHTAPGGDRRGWEDGRTRVGWAADQLRGHGVSVAGLQELQLPQAQAFAAAAPGWAAYPGAAGGGQAVQNSIVWDTGVWARVDAGTLSIPYFFGRRWPMPHVLLQHRSTGQRVWFANFHNPADKFGPAQRWRDEATRLEVALFNRLRAEHPLVVTGDMNEREDYLCRTAREAGLRSADGGYADATGCHPPQRSRVDWILGSPRVALDDYVADESAWVRRTSDHPLLVARATVG